MSLSFPFTVLISIPYTLVYSFIHYIVSINSVMHIVCAFKFTGHWSKVTDVRDDTWLTFLGQLMDTVLCVDT